MWRKRQGATFEDFMIKTDRKDKPKTAEQLHAKLSAFASMRLKGQANGVNRKTSR